MQTVWILHYLNTYLVNCGVFATEQDALDFVANEEHPTWFTPVELPIQPAGVTFETKIPVNCLPQGQR